MDHDSGRADIIPGYWHATPRLHSIGAALNGKYRLFGRDHDLTLGLNGYRSQDHKTGARSLIPDAVNIYEFSRSGDYAKPSSYQSPVPQNGDRAMKLLKMAAAGGSEGAKKALQFISKDK